MWQEQGGPGRWAQAQHRPTDTTQHGVAADSSCQACQQRLQEVTCKPQPSAHTNRTRSTCLQCAIRENRETSKWNAPSRQKAQRSSRVQQQRTGTRGHKHDNTPRGQHQAAPYFQCAAILAHSWGACCREKPCALPVARSWCGSEARARPRGRGKGCAVSCLCR